MKADIYNNYCYYYVTSSGLSNSVYQSKSVHISSESSSTSWFNSSTVSYDISNCHKCFNWVHMLQKKFTDPWFQLDGGTGLLCFILVIFTLYFLFVIVLLF